MLLRDTNCERGGLINIFNKLIIKLSRERQEININNNLILIERDI